MNYKCLFIALYFHPLLLSMNICINNYECLLKNETPTTIAKHIGYHNSLFTFDGKLEGKLLARQTNYFLNFIEEHAKNMDTFAVMEDFLEKYRTLGKESLLKNSHNPLFLNRAVLSKVLSIFHKNKQLIKKTDTTNLIHQITDPLLLHTFIYHNNILKYVYCIPRERTTDKSDIVKKGINFGVNTSIKMLNLFRKEENPINDCSETVINNSPLLPMILNHINKHQILLDNCLFKDKKTTETQIHYIKIMFQPYDYETLPNYKTLSLNIQKKITNFLLCCKHYSKKNKNTFPRPIQPLILKKFISYAHAQRTRDYLLTEVTLLNLAYLDGKEDFSENIKEAINFVKNNLLTWFDDQVRRL